MEKYNVVDAIWYGNIGIVRVRPAVGDDKFYIGLGKGISEEDDKQYIAAWGKPFYPQMIERFCA